MTQWGELLLDIEGFIRSQAREALAKWNDESGSPLPDKLFHYQNGQAVPDKQAPVRFLANRRQIKVLGLGDEGVELLQDYASRIARLVLEHNPEWKVSWKYREGDFKIQQKRPAMVRVSAYVTHRIDGRNEINSEMESHLQTVLQDSLNSEAVYWDADHIPQVRKVNILKLIPIKVKNNLYWPAITCDVLVGGKFVGPWQIGRLKSRGYGNVSNFRHREAKDV